MKNQTKSQKFQTTSIFMNISRRSRIIKYVYAIIILPVINHTLALKFETRDPATPIGKKQKKEEEKKE